MSVLTPTGMDAAGLFNIGGQFLTLTNSVFRQTSDVTVANTTTSTSIVGSGSGSMTIPANSLSVGVAIRLSGFGVYSSATLLPGNLTITLSTAGITFTTSTLTGILVGASNAGFDYSLTMVIRSLGSSGTASVAGAFNYIAALTGAKLAGDLNNSGNPIAIDTTVDNLIDIKATWSTASASNTLKSTICVLEILR